MPLLFEPVAAALGDAEQVRDLPRQHLDADAGEESDQHRRAKEVPDEAQPQQTRHEQQRTADQRRQAGHGEPVLRAGRDSGDAETAQARGEHRGGGRVRAHDEQPRGAQQDEDQGGEDDRVEPGHDRRPGNGRVAHHLGNRHSGQRETGDDVADQPGPLVSAQRLGHQVHSGLPRSVAHPGCERSGGVLCGLRRQRTGSLPASTLIHRGRQCVRMPLRLAAKPADPPHPGRTSRLRSHGCEGRPVAWPRPPSADVRLAPLDAQAASEPAAASGAAPGLLGSARVRAFRSAPARWVV